MTIIRNLQVPTGNILIVEGAYGPLEVLSLGDYGASVNLNQNKPVPCGLPLLPLEEKWVVTISSQYGCSIGCKFCDVPKVGLGRNASLTDLLQQVEIALSLHPEVKSSKRLNIHYARMGEPTYNRSVIMSALTLKDRYPQFNIHPVVSTMCPHNNNHSTDAFLYDWMDVKNNQYNGNAGLQLSINSTSDSERYEMFNHKSIILEDIGYMMDSIIHWLGVKGRKITLNFAVAEYEINASKLLDIFDPQYFIVKLTPMHKTTTALDNNIKTQGNYTDSYPYEHHADNLRKAGYDVLVFIASEDEDLGRITCGNAILSGSLPLVEYKEL